MLELLRHRRIYKRPTESWRTDSKTNCTGIGGCFSANDFSYLTNKPQGHKGIVALNHNEFHNYNFMPRPV